MKPSRSEGRRFCNPRPLAFACLGFLAGVALARRVAPSPWGLVGVAALACAGVALRRHGRAALTAVVCASALLGLVRGAAVFHAPRMPEQRGVIVGTVAAVGRREHTNSQYILADAVFEGRRLETNALITVYGAFDAAAGDEIRCTVKLRPIENYPNATFDYKLWRLSQNVAYQATGNDAAVVGVNADARFWPLRIAKRMEATIRTLYGERAGMVIGMTLGDTQLMPDEQLEAFRASGIAHVLSVSGLHFGFFMLAVQWLMRKRAYVGTLRFLLTLGLLWGYCAVVGSPAPAVRACVMMSIYVLAQWAGWQYDLLTALCFAAALIVFVRPAQLFAAGFCLSFTATAGIALYYKGFAARLMRVRRMPKKLAQGIAVYAAAQIGILPASIWFFSQIQPYGLLGNLIIVPLSGIVTVGGLLSAALGALWLGAGRVVAYPVGVACAGMEWLARALAAMPLAQLGISGLKFLHVALFYFGAAALSRYCLIGRGGKRALAVGVGAAMLATAMLPF